MENAVSMKKIALMFGAVFALCVPLCSYEPGTIEKKTVIVAPLDCDGISAFETAAVYEAFQTELSDVVKFTVIDRSSLQDEAAKQKFQGSDWSDREKIRGLGQVFSADMVAAVKLVVYNRKILATLKLIDVADGKICSAVTEKVSTVDVLIDKMPEMVFKLAGKILLSRNGEPFYMIGDRGPGGGIICCISEKGFTVYGDNDSKMICHYMEVSEGSIGNLSWCPRKSGADCCSPETSTEVGMGKLNTLAIVGEAHKSGVVTKKNCAAELCYEYATLTTEKGEWFLPSRDELAIIYENLHKIGRMYDGAWYWSSSTDNGRAYYQNFSNGENGSCYKELTRSIRCVRMF